MFQKLPDVAEQIILIKGLKCHLQNFQTSGEDLPTIFAKNILGIF